MHKPEADGESSRSDDARPPGAGAVRAIRVLIAEDHALIRTGMCRLLAKDFHVVDAVADGRALLKIAEDAQPDVILLDISMPGLNGLEAARRLRPLCPHARVIFVTGHVEPAYVREAFRAGAIGYVDKCSVFTQLVAAIFAALSDRRYLSLPLTPELEAVLGESSPSSGALSVPLTGRQREVLQLVAEGHTARQIGVMLDLSHKTVEFHKAALMRTLGINTTAELTRYALEHGIAGS